MADQQYLALCRHIIDNGVEKPDRTGTGTLSIFGYQMRFDLSQGFPLLTTKKLHWKSIVYELLWFLRGDTNIKWLNKNGVTIWDEWRRPYSFKRPLVWVTPKKMPYASYSGEFSTNGLNLSRGSVDRMLADIWIKMMRRCYDPTHHRYSMYGGVGVSVNPRWHNLENFIHDAKLLPHWEYKLREWSKFELDKDYYGANQYGPETSVWLRTDENNLYTKSAKPIAAKKPDGSVSVYICLNEASRRLDIPSSTLSRFCGAGVLTNLKGTNKKWEGWEFYEIDKSEKLPRLALIENGDLGPIYGAQWRNWQRHSNDGEFVISVGVDQIYEVINEIKRNPDSRRLLVNAWNVGELDQMALPPCHFAFQFYVANGKLSCQLYQRSGDVFLGVPFNIASYSLLTHMIAHVTGLEVGEFIHTLGDAHIYSNHIEQVKTQLEREPRKLPTLKIKRKVTDIDDFRFEDFELIGYEPHPHIPGKVAV